MRMKIIGGKKRTKIGIIITDERKYIVRSLAKNST